MADNIRQDDNVQHGIDDNPHGDAGKGAALGGIGGAVVGALAGGPVGAVVGAVAGAAASGAGVAAVDAVDNDNTVSGIGDDNDTLRTDTDTRYNNRGELATGSTVVADDQSYGSGTMPVTGATYAADHDTDAGGHNIVTGDEARTDAGNTGLATGAVAGGLIGTAVGGPVGAVVGGTLGSLAGGVAGDATEAADDDTWRRDYDTLQTDEDRDRYRTNLMGADYDTRPVGTFEGRDISRSDYIGMPDTDRQRVQLREEELHVDKQLRQIGEVEISKRVVEEQVNVPVTLEREEVVVHVRDSSGAASGGVGEDQTIVVPVSEEVANVTKDVHVTGEVEIEKNRTTEQKTISDTVRREELDVEGAQGRNVRVEDDRSTL